MTPPRSQLLPGVSVIVPTYRSPGTLGTLCAELRAHVRDRCERFEIVLVDDGNSDDTWETITRLASQSSDVRGVRLLRNYGQHNALLAGFRSGTYPLVLTVDDDLQNPPSEFPKLAAALTDDVDLVYGTPVEQPQGLLRNLASVMTKRVMAKILGPDVFPRSSSVRLFRHELIEATSELDGPAISIDVALSWATTRVRAVPIEFARRSEGRSGYSFRALVRHALNMITGYSTRPLRFVSVIGLLFAAVGFGLLSFVIGRYILQGTAVEGFTFVAAAVSMFAGVQLLSLGILGEYLSRMHFRTMGRPAFTVRDSTGPRAGP